VWAGVTYQIIGYNVYMEDGTAVQNS